MRIYITGDVMRMPLVLVFALLATLGLSTLTSKAQEQDAAKLQQECDGGDSLSCVSLGGAYLRGAGVQKDATRAAALFQRACDAGFAMGCANLGTLYEQGLGVKKDEARALAFHHRACDGDIPIACESLGLR